MLVKLLKKTVCIWFTRGALENAPRESQRLSHPSRPQSPPHFLMRDKIAQSFFGQYYFRLFFMAAYNWKFLLQVPAYNIIRVRRSPSVTRTPSAALSRLRS